MAIALRNALSLVIALILLVPLSFAAGIKFTTAFTNEQTVELPASLHWYAQGSSEEPIELTQYCLEKETFSVKLGVADSVTRVCTIEDASMLQKLSGRQIYAELEYNYTGNSYKMRPTIARTELTKDTITEISDGLKDTLNKPRDWIENLLGQIRCDKTPGICEKKGNYFCFLADANFNGLTIGAVSSVMDNKNNWEFLSGKTGMEIGEDSSNMAMAGCLPKGTTPDIFSALMLKDSEKPITDLTPMTLDISNQLEEVRVLVKNTESVVLKGNLEWYIKPKGETEFVLAKKCAERVGLDGVRSSGLEEIILLPGGNAVFACGMFGFNGIKPSNGPHDVKVYFVGTAEDGRKIRSEIKLTQFKLKTLPGDAPKLSCKDAYGGVCKNWYEGCYMLSELRKIGLFSDCKELKHCCVPMPEKLSEEDLESIDLTLDKFSYGEICDNKIDDNYDGLIDCQDPECWGRMGPDANGDGKPETCCDRLADCKVADEPCTIEYCHSKNGLMEVFGSNIPNNIFKPDSSGQYEEKYLQTCVQAHRAACDPTECGNSGLCAPNTELNQRNTLLKVCQAPDDSKFVCEQCIDCHWDPVSSKCCGDDRHPDRWGNIYLQNDIWCNKGNGACVNGYWFNDHCSDGIKDCDETEKDCGGSDCKPCSEEDIVPDERGSIKASVYKDKNGNKNKDSGEPLFGSDGFSISIVGDADFSETRSVDSSGIVSFENLKAGTYTVKFSSAYSNWKITTNKDIVAEVKASSESQALFGVQGVLFDVLCTPPKIMWGVASTQTCTVKYKKTAIPVNNARYAVTIDGITYSGVSDKDGIAIFIYDPKAKSTSDVKTGMVVSQADLASEKQKTAVLTVSGDDEDNTGQFTFQIEYPSQSIDNHGTDDSGPYWIVTGCSQTCASEGPCKWYRDESGLAFQYLAKDGEGLCDQYFVSSICSGVNLNTPDRRQIGTNPSTEIDENGCEIQFTYMGQDSSVTGKACQCPTKSAQAPTCSDPDGFSTDTKTSIIFTDQGKEPVTLEDKCVDGFLKEQICMTDRASEVTYDCRQTIDKFGNKLNYVCQEGTCVGDCTRCGWLTKGIADWRCNADECAALGSHCNYTEGAIGFGSCGFK